MSSGPRAPSARMAFIERHRAVLVCVGVLPLSCVLKVAERLRRWITAPSPAKHSQRVAAVCTAVRQWASLADAPPMCTDRSSASSHSVRLTDKSAWHKIPMGDLRAILGVDSAAQRQSAKCVTVRVEPGVTVGEVTSYLLARGLQLECTLEMEDATLGGLAAATGMTTHSHVCGLFHDSIEAWEVVTAAGDAIVATASNEHAELYRALPFSHGSLGLVVGLTLRCVPSQPYVRLKYTPFSSREAFAAAYEAIVRADEPPFYVEGIVYSAETAVLMEGVLASRPTAQAPLNAVGRWYKRWFYTHVRATLEAGAPKEETLPMYDYLMRHDRSMCMTMETVMPFGNSAWFRYPFGWSLPPKLSLLKSSHNDETREASVRKQVYQDVAFPAERLCEAIGTSDGLFSIYPLLCYPCQLTDVAGRFVRSGTGASRPFLNLGIYGVPKPLREGRPFKTAHGEARAARSLPSSRLPLRSPQAPGSPHPPTRRFARAPLSRA